MKKFVWKISGKSRKQKWLNKNTKTFSRIYRNEKKIFWLLKLHLNFSITLISCRNMKLLEFWSFFDSFIELKTFFWYLNLQKNVTLLLKSTPFPPKAFTSSQLSNYRPFYSSLALVPPAKRFQTHLVISIAGSTL